MLCCVLIIKRLANEKNKKDNRYQLGNLVEEKKKTVLFLSSDRKELDLIKSKVILGQLNEGRSDDMRVTHWDVWDDKFGLITVALIPS
jgi:hypothetical protein